MTASAKSHRLNNSQCSDLKQDIKSTVQWALKEDIGSGDITAALIPANQHSRAQVLAREQAVLCGQAWVNEVFHQLDPNCSITWHHQDGDCIQANQTIFTIEGNARALLSGERTALNFLQTLSGTATTCRQYADQVASTSVKLLDTRKTLPGLRSGQKYAVSCGGCFNHRIGLFDAYLIKENHIKACGGIENAIKTAQANSSDKLIEIEVENFSELNQALAAGAHRILLDNFSVEQLKEAVAITKGRAELEASGGIEGGLLIEIAKTGVDYISIGALTKHCRAIDLSMRIE